MEYSPQLSITSVFTLLDKDILTQCEERYQQSTDGKLDLSKLHLGNLSKKGHKTLGEKLLEWHSHGITSLSLNNTGLKKLFPELWQLKKLQYLDISGNYIDILPPEIGNLENLQSLDVRQEKILDLPEEMIKLAKLKTFRFKVNNLVHISLLKHPAIKKATSSYNEGVIVAFVEKNHVTFETLEKLFADQFIYSDPKYTESSITKIVTEAKKKNLPLSPDLDTNEKINERPLVKLYLQMLYRFAITKDHIMEKPSVYLEKDTQNAIKNAKIGDHCTFETKEIPWLKKMVRIALLPSEKQQHEADKFSTILEKILYKRVQTIVNELSYEEKIELEGRDKLSTRLLNEKENKETLRRQPFYLRG